MPRPNKLQRWIDLLSALLGRQTPATFDELAREVPGYTVRKGASRQSVKRTFERDKKELRTFGIPIETVGGGADVDDGDAAYRLRAAEFYLPYLSVVTESGRSEPARPRRYGYRAIPTLTLAADELHAIVDAAARVRHLGSEPLRNDVDSALRKIAVDLPLDGTDADGDVHILPARAVAPARVLHDLADALHTRKVVLIDYHALTTDSPGERTVEPFGLVFTSAHWYLVGRDLDRDATRQFRVSRITRVQQRSPTKELPEYTIPRGFDLREYARPKPAWELGDGDPVDAFVDFPGTSGVARAAAALGASVDGHERRRRFDVRRTDVFARWLLSLSGEAVPVGPPAVCAEYAHQLDAVRRRYAPAVARGDAP